MTKERGPHISQLRRKVREDLLKSGLPLEIHVTAELERHGWPVTNQLPYLDFDERKTRTLDIMASKVLRLNKTKQLRFLSITLLVECKHSPEKPWVFYTRPKGPIPPRSLLGVLESPTRC